MSYILYPFLVIINLLGTVLTFPLAPLLVLFNSAQIGWLNNATLWGYGPRLWKLLSWFQTPDNSLDGDQTFKNFYPSCWWSKVHWLWRNPFYGFAVKTFDGSTGMSYSGDLHCDEKNPGHILVKGHGLFQWVYTKHIGSKCLYLNFGWNIRALVDPAFTTPDQWHDNTALIKEYPATFAFSPRLVSYQ
jgi:hypothetical protein